jgi:drug/metabolite transporter (DMT)-like permease
MKRSRRLGAICVLASACVFGAATPVVKHYFSHIDPVMLAGFLNFGSGLGLALVVPWFRRGLGAEARWLARADIPWFASATLLGGAIAPILLLVGLARTPATTASLLLNFEAAFTAMIAWSVFKERIGIQFLAGLVSVTAGGVLLAWPRDGGGLAAAWPALAVVGASLSWAVDTNLMSRVAAVNAAQLVMWRGLLAGGLSILLSLVLGSRFPAPREAILANGLGFVAYGFVMILFVIGLRHLGAGRAGAYFSTAPFVGAVIAVCLGEEMTAAVCSAAVLMAVGVCILMNERHAEAPSRA